MANIYNAAPRPYLDGIKDDSVGQIPVQPEAIPQNCPLYMLQTQRGPLDVQFTVGTPMIKTYGGDSFDESKKFFSHQTRLLATTAGEGNLVAVKRLVNADAAQGVFGLGIELVENENPVYQTNPNGSYQLDINGDRVPTGATRLGYLKRLVLFPGVDSTNWDALTPVPGTLVGSTGQTSTIYPLAAGIAQFGEFSKNVGFRLETPNALSANPADNFAQVDQEALLYRWKWVERSKPGSTPVVTQSLLQSDFIDFSFKRGMINTKTGLNYDYSRVLGQYESNEPGFSPVFGPVEEIKFYNAQIEAVLDLLFAAEEAAGNARVTDKHQINLFGDGDLNGASYLTIQEAPVVAESVVADGNTTYYLQGGSDGTVDATTLDQLARDFLQSNWEDADMPLKDWARYPFSVISDSGFQLDTKFAILDTMGIRDDIKVDVCTYIEDEPVNDVATEIAIGQALQTRGLLTPESIIHGTQQFRFAVWGSEGIFTRSIFNARCTTFVDIAAKRARFAGAGSGVLNGDFAYDTRERNGVELVKNVTHTYKSVGIQDTYWELGINYCEYRTRSEAFWPAYQTGYTEDTSVLNSEIISGILCNLKRQARYHWSINTGDSRLTKTEFIRRSNQDWETLVDGKYADYMVISGETKFTPDDTLRGFSWNLDINASSDPMRTAGQYNITVTRPEE
jgi:hypothetical protein